VTARLFLKLILSVIGVLVVALFAVDLFASRMTEATYLDGMRREMMQKARMAALNIDPTNRAELQSIAKAAGARITVVAKDGRVIADSEAQAGQMENHKDRPEVAAALNGLDGSNTRISHTLGINFLYVAVPIQQGALRVAVPLSEIEQQVNRIRKQVLASIVLALFPSVLIAALFARQVSARLASIIEFAGKLAEGNFRARLDRVGRGELGLLSSKLNETGEKLEHMFEQLQHEQNELEKVERVRKDFVINVSHELRTPLASIQGYTETLLDGAIHDPENNIRFLTIIRQNAERLTRLTADLLTLSRIELKTQKLQLAGYYINSLLEENVDSLRPIAEKKNVTLHIEPAPPETEVFCDSEAVHQILSNLIDNACKYTPENGHVTVGAYPLDDNRVQVFVRDTGIGIPEEDLPRLFERFYRVDKARSRELGGTGLGLAIVKHLVKAQGGEVKVESTINVGSTFLFTLPVEDLGLHEFSSPQQVLATQ
jgi:two-component system phosphate regulon sensor histidine kinase PhoR